MPDTFIKIASVTVGSGGASSIDFTSIPSTYTDLMIYASLRSTTSDTSGYLEFNALTTNLSDRVLYNSNGTIGSNSTSTIRVFSNRSNAASTWSNTAIYIPNYAGSNNKSVSIDQVTEENATGGIISTLTAGLWSSASAITAIKLKSGINYAQYSTAVLYGIKSS